MTSPAELAREVLGNENPASKAAAAMAMADAWEDGRLDVSEDAGAPRRPARPDQPELRPPRDMPKRGRGMSAENRIALLHALAHIEFNAIDLACDLIARFSARSLPNAFYDDWIRVAREEALHFTLLSARLETLGAHYGALPAHDGLWEAAEKTAHDLLARLAIVPLVLEARGLDVTPGMITSMRKANDRETVKVLERIYEDEIGHVAIGRRWFDYVAIERGLKPSGEWRSLVRRYFRGRLKPPFNHDARTAAGFLDREYERVDQPA